MLFLLFLVTFLTGEGFERLEFPGRKPAVVRTPFGRIISVRGKTYVWNERGSWKVNLVKLNGERVFMFRTKLGYGMASLYVYALNGTLKVEGKEFKGTGWKIFPVRKGTFMITIKGKGLAILSDVFVYRAEKKYVFLISADTLRWDFIRPSLTPEIVRFSRDSAVFKNAYSPSSWTLPAHMSVFTSLYSYNHMVYCRGDRLSPARRFLVEALAKDFYTFSFNAGMFVGKGHGFYRGFDWFQENEKDLVDKAASKRMFEEGLKFLQRLPVSNVFAFLHTYQIHSPYQCPDWGCRRGEKESWMRFPQFLGGLRNIFKPIPTERRKNLIELYSDEVAYFDHWFGKFINSLKKMGIYEDSMIILFSDHGEEFFEHQGWGHGHSLFNELIKVPLIVKFPHSRVKGIFKAPGSLVDIFPTVFQEFRLQYKGKMDGVPLTITKNRDIISTLLCPNLGDIPYQVSFINGNKKVIVIRGGNFKKLPYQNIYLRDGSFGFDLGRDPMEKSPSFHDKNYIKRGVRLIRKFKRRGRKGELEKLKALGYI